ncbi:uncharacterized protein JCM6883_003423 [Sporobolomyces salmoneus]|uniref:uncharacterized protein n=1 Tax=Sporobolomyces salmoneus TaxID=183962 RepID=UPI003177B34E
MPTGYTSSFKLCTISTLPRIEDALNPPQVRICARVIGLDAEQGLCLVADPVSPGALPTIILDFNQVVLDGNGSVLPPKLKDLVMIFGELVPNTLDSSRVPRNQLGFLNAQLPDSARLLVAKRLARIEEGHGAGFDVNEWSSTVENVQSHLAAR